MIISHKHKFIFLKPLIVAGSSTELFLADLCGPDDIITPLHGRTFGDDDEAERKRLRIKGPQNYLAQLRGRGLHEWLWAFEILVGARSKYASSKLHQFRDHMGAISVRALIGPEIFDSYEKLSILRNPFTLAVSRYNYFLSDWGKTPEELSFGSFVAREPSKIVENKTITSINGAPVIDTWFRFEHLAADIGAWLTKRGLTSRFEIGDLRLKDSRKLARAMSLKECYRGNQEAVDLISLLWKPEIKAYGFDTPSTT